MRTIQYDCIVYYYIYHNDINQQYLQIKLMDVPIRIIRLFNNLRSSNLFLLYV